MLTVTVVKNGSRDMKVVGEFTSGRCLNTGYASSCDHGALAAKALQMAMSNNDGEYVIIAPDAVLALIPKKLHSKLNG